jgi:Lon protease-like protein
MMFDIANSDDMFGYIHTDNNGRIASVGTMCKVTDRQLLEDGRQYIALEGVGRFRAKKILKTLPYVTAEVEPDLLDDVPEDEAAVAKLESQVYDSLKYYMRLMKCYEPNKNLVISQAAKKNRPTNLTLPDQRKRRTDFSFSLANMIQMTQAKESQLLLQTTDIMKRLEAEKAILSQAAELIAEQLVKMGVLTADRRDEIKMKTLTGNDDFDILPPDVIDQEATSDKDEWDLSNME